MSVDTLVKQIEQLPLDQRVELFDCLDQIFGESEEPIELSAEMKTLLDERNAAYEADPTNLVTWEQVIESLGRKQ